MLTKMTDTFDIQMNNIFRTKFAHQCKFISALHAIIPINNSMQHYLFSSLELRCRDFFPSLEILIMADMKVKYYKNCEC